MAQRGAQLDPRKLSCSICLDLLKDPVTVPCGHSYCSRCIQRHWEEDVSGFYSCPQCRKRFLVRPDLTKNILLAELVEDLKNTELQAAAADLCSAGPEDVSCDVCFGRKLKAVKSCLVCVASFCEKHLQPHYKAAPLKKHQLVEPSKKLQERICSLHDEVMKIFCRTDQQSICYLCLMDQHRGHETVPAAAERRQKQKKLEESRLNIQQRIQEREKDVKLLQQQMEKLEQRITVLKRKDNQLEQLAHTEDHTQFLLRATKEELFLPQPETRADILQYSLQITLDRDTVHSRLLLSDEDKNVSYFRIVLPYLYHPDRFTDDLQVLSSESLIGRSYWEVEWRGRGVIVAVSYRNISRSGRGKTCVFGFNNKSWALICHSNGFIFCHNTIQTPILGPLSSRVGVYLDDTAGILAFFSVSQTMTLLHTFQTTFTQPLYAGVGICPDDGSSAEFLKPQ